MPVQELQQKTTSTEFNDWNYYFNELYQDTFDIDRWYLAQIAFLIERQNKPKNWPGKIRDFLVRFNKTEKPGADKTLTEVEAKKQRAKRSKASWLGFLGIKPPADGE